MEAKAKRRLLLVIMHLLLPVLLFFMVIGTCRSTSRAGVWKVAKDTRWKQLEQGLESREAQLTFRRSDDSGVLSLDVDLTALRIDPLRYRLEAALNPVKDGRTIAEVVKKHKALAAVNGGYFDHKCEPNTLVVSGGKVLSELNAQLPDTGILVITGDGKASIRLKEKLPPPYEGVDFAVQNQPLLVRHARAHFRPRPKPKRNAAKPRISRPHGHRRTVAGVDLLGRVVLVVCDKRAGLVELAGLLAMPRRNGGFGLAAAVNLDGGPSSGLAVDHAKLKKHVEAGRTVPCVILVRRRPKPLVPQEKKKPQAPPGEFVPVRPRENPSSAE